MFAGIAAEQPDLQLPTEAAARRHLPRPRQDARHGRGPRHRLSDAVDLVGRGRTAPSRRSTCTGSTGRRRCCACCDSAPRTPPNCPTCGAISLPDPRIRRSSSVGSRRAPPVSERMRTRWLNFAVRGEPAGLPGDPQWRPYRAEDRATLVIDKQDARGRRPGPRTCGRRGATTCSVSAEYGSVYNVVPPGGVDLWTSTWTRAGFSRLALGRAAAADARPGDVRRPVLLLLLIIEWTAARKLEHDRGRPGARRGLPEARRVGQHLDGPGVDRAPAGLLNAHRPARHTPRCTSTWRRGTCRRPPGTRG